MNIPELGREIKGTLESMLEEWGLVVIVLLACIGSFGLGRLSALEDVEPPVSIARVPAAAEPVEMYLGGLILASRTGSTYYYPWCGGASNISLSNQVWFKSEDAAKKAGYRPAKNCKGLSETMQ